MKAFFESLSVPPEVLEKLIISIIFFIVLTLIKFLSNLIVRKRVKDDKKAYSWNRAIVYIYTVLLIILIGSVWVKGMKSLTTFLGLASAGLAIAMHDTIANLAGWFYIMSVKPFKVGDRIEVDHIIGDVIDLRILQFSMVECGNWVDADQSTGRIIHIPNSKAITGAIANYEIGFKYIWNEVPVLITFESDWKKAKELINKVSDENVLHLSQGAQQQIRKAAKKYLIFYDKLTPIVYTTVKESGVLLTLRYLVSPRLRRNSEHQIWEALLDALDKEDNIQLAYPTKRTYMSEAYQLPGVKNNKQ
ncbi:MAG: mechanosensitive ion channel family protein [Candidatus Marinimicrobia bacterium]|nr:mechanosensitive ion channel family protein [Candidatus Neomarinimicrobiota bacterium]